MRKLKLSSSNKKYKFFTPKRPTQGLVQIGKTKLRHGISLSEKRWLDKLGVQERSVVVMGFNNKPMIVDGYDRATHTYMEYLGSSWHGHPKKFNLDDMHPVCKKTYRELYYNTMKRFQLLHDFGAKVFFVWCIDDKKGHLGRYYRGPGDNLL